MSDQGPDDSQPTTFERAGATLRYEVEGDPDGEPVLLLAPGGMRSTNAAWRNVPWNPRARLADRFRLVGMDQRNAGRSTAPVHADDGWPTYTADQLALLDHLDIERCHLLGMCIGGPFAFGLLDAAPERVASAVLLQPVGIEDNRPAFYELFDGWSADLVDEHPEADEAAWSSYRSNMWDGDFVLTATPDQVSEVTAPVLLASGRDHYHPRSISLELRDRLPDVTFLDRWKDDDVLDATTDAVRAFLADHPLT